MIVGTPFDCTPPVRSVPIIQGQRCQMVSLVDPVVGEPLEQNGPLLVDAKHAKALPPCMADNVATSLFQEIGFLGFLAAK